MKISVCIPCIESHIPLLYRCIKYINKQTRLPDEILISVSNVSEKSWRDINKLLRIHPNIRVSATPEKKYAGENRNIAISMSTGDVVTFIDADDIMYKNRIKIIERVFNNNKNCVGLLHYFKENSEPREEKYNKSYLARYQFDKKIHFGHPTFKRFVFDEFHYSDKPRGQDVEFIESILPKYLDNLYVYKAALTCYMSNDSSYFRNI